MREITLCVFSLAQYTEYDDRQVHTGHVELFMGKDNSLGFITVGGELGSLYVCFAKCNDFTFKKGVTWWSL